MILADPSQNKDGVTERTIEVEVADSVVVTIDLKDVRSIKIFMKIENKDEKRIKIFTKMENQAIIVIGSLKIRMPASRRMNQNILEKMPTKRGVYSRECAINRYIVIVMMKAMMER